MLSAECLSTVKSHFDFIQVGETTGNLTIGRGHTPSGGGATAAVFVAIIENKIASGSLGAKECNRLASLFTVVESQKRDLVLYIDSAGARVSEGLVALGAFRHMYRAALVAAASGVPITAYCGANCFGGASMLAALANKRVYSANSRFAMSGPAIIAQAAGFSASDDMFIAMSDAAISGEARVKLGETEMMAANPAAMHPPRHVANVAAARHTLLGRRLEQLKSATSVGVVEKVERKDLAKLYAEGYRLEERDGVLTGEARHGDDAIALVGLIGGRVLGAVRAWLLADVLWRMVSTYSGDKTSPTQIQPATLHLLVDCDSHATSLDDERIMLSAYLADIAAALQALSAAGTHIETTVLGKLGGGVYVALAAPVNQVNMLYGTEIQLLPGRAIASILGDSALQKHGFDEYRAARVADRELKLGIL